MIEAPEARYLCEQLTETVVGKEYQMYLFNSALTNSLGLTAIPMSLPNG